MLNTLATESQFIKRKVGACCNLFGGCEGNIMKSISVVAAHEGTQGSRTIGLCKLYGIRDMACGWKEQRKAKHLSVNLYTKEEGEWRIIFAH